VGDRAAGVAAFPPYQGWEQFRPRIENFLKIVAESDLVGTLERFSLKFVNILAVPEAKSQLGLINADLVLGGLPVSEYGFGLRTEFNDPSCVRIIEIKTNINAKLPNGDVRSGLMLSIDCVQLTPNGKITELDLTGVEGLHQQLKQVFFGLITAATLNTLGPEF